MRYGFINVAFITLNAVLRIVYLIYKEKNCGGEGDLSKICPDHPKTKERNMKIYFEYETYFKDFLYYDFFFFCHAS